MGETRMERHAALPKRGFLENCKRQRSLILMALPAFLIVLVFHYIPMYGIVMAFQDFKVPKGILGSKWVGLKWFSQYLTSPMAFRTFLNTLRIGTFSFIFTFPAPILLALMINEVQQAKLKRGIQTISYFPSFISSVIIVGMMKEIFSLTGPVNTIITSLGGNGIHFFARPEWFQMLYISSGLWQGLGTGSIIYLAALTDISQELYEAAEIDGCSRLKKMLHISLPGITPTIVILFILNAGSIVSVDTNKVLLMYNAQTYSTADTIGTYVYREGLVGGKYSYTTAIGLFINVISCAVVLLTNAISRRVSENSLW